MGSCTYVWAWLGVFFMPWGSLCVLCGLCVLLSCPCCLLTPLQPLPWLCIPPLLAPPSPYHGCCAPSEGFMATPGSPTGPQPLFPGHPVPSSWSQGLQCWCSQGRWMHRCWSVIGCSWLLVGSSGNSECVWHGAVQLGGRAEAFDNNEFCFFLFSKI